MMTNDYYRAKGNLRRKWYQLDMNSAKSRIKPETKARMHREFDDAVLHLAEVIRRDRQHDRTK